MRCALRWNSTRSRRIGQCFRPCCNVGMVAFGVCLELLAEVCIEGSKAILTAEVLACATLSILCRNCLLLEGLFVLQDKVEQLSHGALFLWLPRVFVVMLGAEQSLVLTSRRVVTKDRLQHVGAAI
jgi:hypothetical protein